MTNRRTTNKTKGNPVDVLTPNGKKTKATGVVPESMWPTYGHYMGKIRPNPKQIYGTPWWFADWMNKQFGERNLDVCALAHNKKAKHFIGPVGYLPETEDTGWIGADGLATPWHIPGDLSPARVFCNPEYADITPWLQRAAQQAKAHNCHVLVLTPLATPGWFSEGHAHAYAIHTFDKRIDFDPAPGVTCTDSNPKDSMLWEFRRDRVADFPLLMHHHLPKPKKERKKSLRKGEAPEPAETTAA